MSSTIRVDLPIWLQPKRYDAEIVRVGLECPDLSAKDAPVVMRWRGNDRFRIGDIFESDFEFRSYAGSIWSKVVADGPVDRPASIDAGVLASGLLQMPSISNANRPKAEHAIDLIGDDPMLSKVLRVSPDLGTNAIMIEGKLWLRSHGPMLRSLWGDHLLKHPRLAHVSGKQDVVDPDKAMLAFPAWRRDEVESTMTEIYGKRPSIVGRPVEVLGDVPPGDTGNDLLHLALERVVWHFLWEARFMGQREGSYGDRSYSEEVGSRGAQLVVEARAALQRRWEGVVDTAVVPTTHAALSPHLHGRTVKEARELLPLIDDIVAFSKQGMRDYVHRNWTAVRAWAAYDLQLVHEAAEELEGFAL